MKRGAAVSETGRQLVHIAVGAAALLLRYLTWFEATMLGLVAVTFNSFFLHRVGGARLFRPEEHGRWRVKSGIVLYPSAVLGLLVLLPSRMDVVAGAWGVLAAGDGMATLVGRRFPLRPLPWNPHKSLGGTLAFMLFGGAAAVGLLTWCADTVVPPAFWWYPLAAGILAAVAAALVETIPISLDDNISVAGTAAATIWAVSLVSEELVLGAAGTLASVWPAAVGANAIVAAAGYLAGTVSLSGTIAGLLIGIVIYAATGWQGWVLLLTTFALAVIASRAGLRRKQALKIEEARGGRRGAGNALANTGIAAAAALVAMLSPAQETALLVFVAALAAGGSDTIASEIGKAWGRHAFLITNGTRVKPGTSGAVSVEGTVAGILGALALAALGAALGLVDWEMLAPIVVGATIGSMIESTLGASLEHRGVVNNDVLNLVNTAVAAYAAVTLSAFV